VFGVMEEDYPRTLLELERASARSKLAGSTCSISAGRTDSVVLDVKQARAGCGNRVVFGARAAAIRFR
jgi:hypothetical protein